MSWLIRLYPPAWRRRYGRELAELLATQPASFGTAIDLVAGAIDAWFNPQSSTAAMAADPKEAGEIAEMLKLRGSGYGVNYTAADSIKAVAVTIVGTLLFVLGIAWAEWQYSDNPYVDILGMTLWMVPLFIGLSFSPEWKVRSFAVKAVFVGGLSTFVIGVALASAWANA